jgi:glycine/D-amino acid oxidase-like deaminating enzyme
MAAGLELGSVTQFLDPADMRARGIPPAFLFGCYTPRGGTLDPGKYVTGLRRAAIDAGVRLYENTALLSYEEGATVRVHTAKGGASAPFLVLATNAYTPQLGLLGNKVAPMRVSAIETEPLSPAQLASLGWPAREGIMTPHWVMESHRLTARNSLVITTKRLNYVYGSKTPNVPDEDAYSALAAALRDRFPTLRGLGIRSCWSGYISLAYDALPVVGESGEYWNILYSAGCSGHGVATQSMMGQMLADWITGTAHPHLAALDHKTPSTLPEPLQWCAIKGALALTNRMDERVNRKARRAAGGGE